MVGSASPENSRIAEGECFLEVQTIQPVTQRPHHIAKQGHHDDPEGQKKKAPKGTRKDRLTALPGAERVHGLHHLAGHIHQSLSQHPEHPAHLLTDLDAPSSATRQL